ncbi:MAG: hypothetical protein EG825_09740 [Rhodocyclaceae bacterium]|nr:hypothetical protein [Rhodocyclaceae bacterium]
MQILADKRKIPFLNDWEQEMPKAVVEDWDAFRAFLAAQPLCKWSAQKQREIDSGALQLPGASSIHAPSKKNDNADLAAALASMA